MNEICNEKWTVMPGVPHDLHYLMKTKDESAVRTLLLTRDPAGLLEIQFTQDIGGIVLLK